MSHYEVYIQKCFELAARGLGLVAPNPLVGCVIVYKNKIIGEGWHEKSGAPHAEVNAIDSVRKKELLSSSTLYVNLEPCSHYGKTPPCTDLILRHNIPEVVISNKDPFPEVNGRGIEKLARNGCSVITDICHSEGRFVNRRFFTFHEKHRPYIILKWAKTMDGFMDIDRSPAGSRLNYWITNDHLVQLVHRWRTEESAVMVGANTAINDNPQLTARLWKGRNPVRIVLAKGISLSPELSLFDGLSPTIVFTDQPGKKIREVEYVPCFDSDDVIECVMHELYKRNIQSLIVEGGRQLLDSFIERNLWDEARVLTGNKDFITGLRAPSIKGVLKESTFFGNDLYQFFLNENL